MGRPGKEKEGTGHPRGGGHRMGGPQGAFGEWHHPLAFLLFDPAMIENAAETAPRLNTYPNPSRSLNTLEYTLESRGTVQIDLLDNGGNIVKQLVSTLNEAGTYSLSVDLADLRPGVYIYRIRTAGNTQTQKLVVE